MSELSITRYFPFMRVKITGQTVHSDIADSAMIRMAPDLRYRPLCHHCHTPAGTVHSNGHSRFIRDLNMAKAQVWLQVEYRKVWCDNCDGARVEHLSFVNASKRVTDRMKNEENLSEKQQYHLQDVLELNSTLNALYVLKDHLKLVYYYSDRQKVKDILDNWCEMAGQIEHPSVTAFIKRLRFFEYGILNHADYPIGTSRLEGANNKIKVVNDQFGSPTWSHRLALQIARIIDANGQGTYHATAEGYCTWYELASYFLEKMDCSQTHHDCWYKRESLMHNHTD